MQEGGQQVLPEDLLRRRCPLGPLGWTSSYQPENNHAAQLHGSVVALTLMCACAHSGISASCLALSALPKTQETRIRDAHAGELHSFVICEGVVPEELKQQAPARSHRIP